MNGPKKLGVRILITLYGISYLLQNSVFINRKNIYGAGNPSTTNLVAIFVDKNIYTNIYTNLEWYAKDYIQQKIANSKTVIFPIDTTTLKAHEIVQILENMYFEGLKDESSKLVGTILMGDIPLPVVENNGFMYPSIFPYVDFENQQFIYNTNKKYFVYNDNPNGQAELRHGMIKFDTTSKYNDFFTKVKSYYNNPTTFIDKAIRYDDFIGLKKYFIPENTKYYINSMIFAEDIGYHRFNNLLVNVLKDEHNEGSIALSSDLKTDLQDTTDPELKAYANDIDSRNSQATNLSQQITSNLPTLTLKKSTQEMLKGYDGLISSQFLAKIKDNIGGLARRYKTNEGETFADYSSVMDKIVQKDMRIAGDLDNNVQPLIIQLNDFLESGLNAKIEQEKYYMTIPIPVNELDFEGKKKGLIKKKCTWKTYNYYENYYFGQNADTITSAEETNIYRGTFQNLTSLSGQKIKIAGQSIGGSYKVFSTQIEANRGYNFNTTIEEVDKYNKYKTNKQDLRQLKCTKYFLGLKRLGICMKPRTRTVNDGDDQNKCYINDIQKQGGCESLPDFSLRNRGGGSPLSMDSTTQTLKNYNYKNAVLPLYDIAGSKKIETAAPDANSFKGAMTYSNMIQKKFGVGDLQHGSNNISSLIQNPLANGGDLVFTNKLPVGDLEDPTRVDNTPRTYAQTNFFTQFNALPSHMVQGKEVIIYKKNSGSCGGDGSVYTYKTIDSRVKNISPTRDQLTDTEFYKFKDPADLKMFYTKVMTYLAEAKNEITKTTQEFSGTDSTDMTGVISNLKQIKKLVASGNLSMQQIISFNENVLGGYNQTQLAQLANTWTENNLTPEKSTDIQNRITIVNDGLESLLNYANSINISNVGSAFAGIINSEKLKNQKVEIVNTWKANITQNLNYIETNVNTLKTTFTQARGLYNSIGQLNNNISAIQDKKSEINGVATCGSPNPLPCGCDSSHYKIVCDALDTIVATLQTNLTNINDALVKIHLYETNESGTMVTTKPFDEINEALSPASVAGEISDLKATMNTFDVSSDINKIEKHKGINLTTQDRPIDNIRNITFQGVGGDLVRLNYPNLYEAEIYKKVGDKLILKGTGEIREAIKTYLTNKAVEYNTILQAQQNKKNQYYTAFKNQFILLGQVDALANPNTHTYSLLPTDYFVNQLVAYLDILKNAPEYGKQAIYGIENANTIDEKLNMIAKMVYYQNITRQERLTKGTVIEDMTEIKNSFDINQKISQVTNTYLTKGVDQGKFITPTYNTTGYEVGYINSDGEDYVSAKPLPAFIKQIQTAQEQQVQKPANRYEEGSTADLLAEVDTCEGVDTQGAALLFDLKTFSSPWAKAMKCRRKKISTKPFNIEISFKNAQGPVILGAGLKNIISEMTGTAGEIGTQRKEYGAQRTPTNNEETIQQAEANIQEKLQGYNNYALVNVDKTILGVDYTGSAQIKIGMSQDMGKINVKISGTGDNCFGIKRKVETGKAGTSVTLSENICTKKAQEYYNPNTESLVFDIVIGQDKKAGSTALKIELCPSIGNACIIKQQVLHIIPGPINSINIQSPDRVMAGGEIPVVLNAADKYGNSIGQSIQAYTISVNSGDGKINNGGSASASMRFDNFSTSAFVYQAPTNIKDIKNIIISVVPDQTDKKLGDTKTVKAVQKTIQAVKGIITVIQNNIVLYQTDLTQKTGPKIKFTLPKDETDIQYTDSGGIAQIKPENIPSLIITVKDKNGKALDTVANITSKQGLLIPGTIKEKRINETKKQFVFNQKNDIVITSGRMDITLYPSFKAGNDTITIYIPGTNPINIPVTVNPGKAKTVVLKLEKSKMDLTTNTGSKGTIQVVDSWNNKVNTGTVIKLGVIGSAYSNVSEFTYTGNEYVYSITTTGKGGEGYVFAYIKDRGISEQVPGYERFIIQDSILPKEKLNIMYLNLFGTDWGNQRGYFSENNKAINSITEKSDKLLATTTEIVDPNKIKQIEYIISPHGQIQSIGDKEYSLIIENKEFIAHMPDIANIHLGKIADFKIQKIENTGAVVDFTKNSNTLLYIPEPTDSVVTGNEATKSQITINGMTIIDLDQGTMDSRTNISADNEMIGDMSTYTVTFNSKIIGKMFLRNTTTTTIQSTDIDIKDPLTYGQTTAFNQGSTNSTGIGIYINTSVFSKQGYLSIEDSSDALLGIGFTSDFKNVANFANGKSVGESTLPYGSQFLINFGDPLLQRRDKNTNIPDTDFDASIGQTIYADPNKTIFKTIPIDFNKDGLKDLIVVYTDGMVKLVKNYGGTEPYKNLQELMIIAEPIKEIKIGDVDGNGYEDIFIITNNDKGIVYLNDKGTFPVDGKNVCLNVNSEPSMENPNPDDFSNIRQMFVQDMNKDGKLDIVTNDAFSDIKIFYGGSTKGGGPNYLSLVTGLCDDQRYTRQKNNYTIVKRYGIKANNNRYIQDNSLVHRKGAERPTEGITEEIDAEAPDTTAGMSETQLKALKDKAMSDIKTMVADTETYVAAGKSQLAYMDNPLTTAPVYESLPAEEITYLPISETNDVVSIYKTYADVNGGVLRQDDEVVIKTTILSKKNNNKLTYIDQLQGPWNIATDSANKIPSMVFLTNNTGSLIMDRDSPQGYQLIMDNIKLNSGERLSFSYVVKYQAPKQTITIDVQDTDLLKENMKKDTYPDIIVSSTDACQKNRWIFFNEKIDIKKTYEEIYEDIQKEINEYNSGAKAAQETAINDITDQIASTDTLNAVSSLPGMNNLEGRSAKNILSSLLTPGGLGQNINLANSFIDSATAKVSKKLDAALKGLCQGFSLGDGKGCTGIPVPFNQAFLAPGDYHIFGCVPKLPNPLYPIFRTLNTTLGKGMPLLNIPGNRGPTPIGYIPAPGIFGFPFKGTTDGFFLGVPGGTYPSVFRLYIAPTLTLGLGIAMCFGPYTVGKAIPKPFRDLGGNCIVFAIPPITNCPKPEQTSTTPTPTTDSVGASMVAAASQGTCNNPPKIGNTIVFAGDTEIPGSANTINSTANSPFQMVVASSSQNNPNYAAAIPQGNFGGLISIDQEPLRVSAEEYGSTATPIEGNYEGYTLEKGEKITLKKLGGKTKGLVKCIVQDWMTRQISYIQNNLTKMTIEISLPDLSTVFQGFDKIGNLEETYKAINAADKQAGYIQNTSGAGVNIGNKEIKWTEKLSTKSISNLSNKMGKNPFEAIQQMFKEVPLVNIDTKTLNIKIPAITSEDINKYIGYLTLWIEKNGKILEDWTSAINEVLAMCGTTDKQEAGTTKQKLETEKTALAKPDNYTSLSPEEKTELITRINSEIKDMEKIMALSGNTTRKEMGADVKNIKINASNTARKISKLPKRQKMQSDLQTKKEKMGNKFPAEDQARLDAITEIITPLQKCAGAAGSLNNFLSFRENTAGLIKSVKENINVLEKYKQFPAQLYQWTHLTDRYLTELSSLLGNFVGGINNFLSVNATRYSQYIDAIVLLVGAIKTRQAIIDLSVNRSERCSKCSNDNYGSFSCSLSFLCPKLPIFPIPAFKIPNIYMDLSHVELGMNIILPKINFVPIKIPLPQLPNLPEPPEVELDFNINLGSLPAIPVIPEPPTLPEPPSFIPSIKMDLPVLPPAPKIPKIMPEINAVLKVADFIGKIFCIVKGGIGLVGEKGVKSKIEQITQRTRNVPIFDFFDMTTKFKDPPLQGFDYRIDAYTTLKFNFDGVYDVFNSIASMTNNFVSKQMESRIQKATNRVTDQANNNPVTNGLNNIENFNQKININYNTSTEESGMIDYHVAYNDLKQGLIQMKNSTTTDKKMNDRVKTILATVENKSTILPATDQIQAVEKAAKDIINKKIQENKQVQKEIGEYDTFIKNLQDKTTVLVSDETMSATLTSPLLTMDGSTKQILDTQENPTKTYLDLNKKMVQGYLDAVNNDGPEKLNMSITTYKKSKTYLEETKGKINTALLAYTDTPLLAQGQGTCTNCSSTETNYSTDISSYVQGVFIESYSGNKKNMVNTVSSAPHIQNVQQTYTTKIDLNNDTKNDILMYDAHTIYVKYAKQESEHMTPGGNTSVTHYNKLYSYANEFVGALLKSNQRYVKSLEQLRNNSDAYGYMKINDITIKVIDKNNEPKNFKTQGQTFDTLQLSRKNSKILGEPIDGYIIKVSNKVDDKDTPSSFRNILGGGEKPKYIIVLPKEINYTGMMITIDENMKKSRITSQLGNSILAVEYFDPEQSEINVIFKNLPRKRLYTSIAGLTDISETLTTKQQQSLSLYKKTSPRSNQTVAGMQNLGDTVGPIGDVVLWRNLTNETISTGLTHEGYINTNYTLKSIRTDNVAVARMEIRKDGKLLTGKDNQSQTGIINLGGLFFSGTTQERYDFVAIDHNDNVTKETVNLSIQIPNIEVIDLKKTGEKTAEIIAKISNDLDEGTVIFQRLRNGIRKNMDGTEANQYSGFGLLPKQTIITGGIFTIGNDIGLYDTKGNELATIDPKTGEIQINQGYKNTVKLRINLNSHIPVVELVDIARNVALFQIVLPLEGVTIQMDGKSPYYEQIHLTEGDFGDFDNGYCIKNINNECILYTNNAGAIYIPGEYASSLAGEYLFDTTIQKPKFIIKDQSGNSITTLILQFRASQ